MNNQDRPIGMLSYTEQLQMETITKLEKIVKLQSEIISLYQAKSEVLPSVLGVKND